MKPRRWTITRREAGQTLTDVLRAHHLASSHDVRQRRVWLDGKPCLNPAIRVRQGQCLEIRRPQQPRPPTRPQSKHGLVIRHADEHVVVVDKPAGITTMRHPEEAAEFGRGRRFLPPTVADLLPDLLAARPPGKRTRVRPVHRLDKETSGLVVFARTVEAERHLGRQFRAHTVERTYLALVRGRARDERIESFLVRDRGDGRRGSGGEPGTGQRVVTHVRVVEALGAYTLVECRLETGRTHQVRIHLGEAGTPLCGERIYDRPLHGTPLPDGSGMARPALHAASLGFEHPGTGRRVVWQSRLPKDMIELLRKLRAER
jgi:23S rRNA pseudouridine1911/1915/1917 synthase